MIFPTNRNRSGINLRFPTRILLQWMCLFILLNLTAPGHFLVAAKKTHEQKGDEAFAAAKYKDAVKEYKKAVKEFPDDVDLRFKLARAYIKKGEIDNSLAEFIRITNQDPTHVESFRHLGDYFAMKKDHQKAAKAYESLVGLQPDNAQYHFLLAKELQQLYQIDQAIYHFYKTLLINQNIEEVYPFLFQLLQQKLVQNPQDPDTHMVLGRVYKMHGDYGEARAQFTVVIQLQPEARDGWEDLLFVCQKLEDCQGEVIALKGLLEFDVRDIKRMDQLIDVTTRCELWEDAREYLSRRISLVPDEPAPYKMLGELYQRENNRVQAYFYYREFLARCPDCAETDTLKQWCQNEELVQPEISRQFEAFSAFQLGLSSFRNGNFEDALTHLSSARNIFSGFPQVHFYLGQTLEELQHRDQALFSYKEAIKLDPSNPEYWYFLGNSLHILGMFTDAAICLQKVLELDPQNQFGYGEATQNILQTYQQKGIIKPKKILDIGN